MKAESKPSIAKRKPVVSYRVDHYLQDKLLSSSKRRLPTKEGCAEGCTRTLNFCRFCLGCSASISQVLAPWVLAIIELVSVMLIYFLGTSRPLVDTHRYRFQYMHSLEDILGLSIARTLLLSLAYAWGVHRVHSVGWGAHKPYLYASYLLAASCFPYIIIKMILYRYGQDSVAAASIFILTGSFTWFHVFAARRTVEWTRKRYQMGLAGFGLLWEEGAGGGFGVDGIHAGGWTWLPGGRRPDMEEMDKGGGGGDGGVFGLGLGFDASAEDVPPETLSDPDSRFVEVNGIRIHYKEVSPSSPGLGGLGQLQPGYGSSSGLCCDLNSTTDLSHSLIDPEDPTSTGIVLVHGFGGGVFAWRHVMEALASQCQCRVVAFDRPAFGLTTRPMVTQEQRSCPHTNPYSMGAQAELMLQLCAQLGLSRVLLVAHGDACILALRAASEASASSSDYNGDRLATDEELSHNQQQLQALYGGGLEGASQETSHCSNDSSLSVAPQVRASFANVVSSSDQGPPGSVNPRGTVTHLPTERSSSPPPPIVFSAVISAAAAAEAELAASSFASALTAAATAASGGNGDLSEEGPSVPSSTLTSQRPSVSDITPLLPGLTEGNGMVPIVTVHSRGGGGGLTHSHSLSASGVPLSSLAPPASVPASLFPSPMRPGQQGPPSQPAMTASSSPNHPNHHVGGGGRDQRRDSANIQGSGSFPLKRAHRRSLSLPMSQPLNNPSAAQGSSSSSWIGGNASLQGNNINSSHHLPAPSILGLALLHPNLVGQGPTLSRLLARSKFGRSILRPLLRSEVGEISNRRAWHHAERLTPEVLELYKSPLRVEGWDMALVETARLTKDQVQGDLGAYIEDAAPIPALVLTAMHDIIATPAKAESLWQGLPRSQLSVLPDCGHLSHEEAPGLLLGQLVPFLSAVLDESRR